MKKALTIYLLAFFTPELFSEESGPVCKKCEKVREYNASHTENNYTWYDDYLKDKKEGKAKESSLGKENQEDKK